MSGLQGRSIVNTRARHQAAALDSLLRRYGAEPLDFPCIDIAPPEDTTALDNALRMAAHWRYQWLILTSANTVRTLEIRLKALDLSFHPNMGAKIAAIGPATAEEALTRLGWQANVIPEEYIGEALADSVTPAVSHSGQENQADTPSIIRVLLPQSDIADSALAERLRQRGAQVTEVQAYRTVIGNGGVDLPELLECGAVDAITFTSGSTVVNCFARLRNEAHGPDPLADVTVACIGPKTAEVARDFGLTVSVIPTEHTLDALVAALDAHFLSLDSGESA